MRVSFLNSKKMGKIPPFRYTIDDCVSEGGEFFVWVVICHCRSYWRVLFSRPRCKDTIPPTHIPYADLMSRKARLTTRPNIPSPPQLCGYGLACWVMRRISSIVCIWRARARHIFGNLRVYAERSKIGAAPYAMCKIL